MASTHRQAAPDSQIALFWSWFQSVAAELSCDLSNSEILSDLDAKVAGLGELSWEVGPGCKKSNALVITPDGDKDWLAAAKHIIDLAPSIPGWELHSSRPPRQWNLSFSFEGTSGLSISVDANSWRYVLYRFPDKTFDMVLEQPNLDGVDEDERFIAATILLDGVVGERTRLETIESIECVLSLPEELSDKASPMSRLAEHLASLRET